VLPAGPAAVSWDGRGADGLVAADGAYDVVVEARHPDGTRSILRAPVAVDTAPPAADLATTRVELSGADATSFALPVELSEAAHVDLAVTGAAGPTLVAFDQAAGPHDLDVPIASRPTLDRVLRRGAAQLWVRVTVTDPAGNRGSTLARVRLGSGTLDWPLLQPALSSPFGVRWGRRHEGVDLAARPGARIRAADGGVVVRAGWWGGYGNVVVIDHGTRTTLYGHQSRLAVRTRQVVTRGQVIGYVGSTGHSTGPHLHFELRIDGELMDPLDFLPPRRLPVVP
jgi:murein DD-endopeptidase MepM/ murein hydrolase activator NlpD